MGLISLLYSDPSSFIILCVCLVFSLCFHEFAHAICAFKLGDDTAYRQNRVNINPLNHLDPLGTVMILFVGFGWAKPVPVNPLNLRNKESDMMKIAFAGPAANLFIAFFTLFMISIFPSLMLYEKIVTPLYFINIFLAIFNLLPISPLDGSQIFNPIIMKYNRNLAHQLIMNGPMVLFGIIIFGHLTGFSLLSYILYPAASFIDSIFSSIISFFV